MWAHTYTHTHIRLLFNCFRPLFSFQEKYMVPIDTCDEIGRHITTWLHFYEVNKSNCDKPEMDILTPSMHICVSPTSPCWDISAEHHPTVWLRLISVIASGPVSLLLTRIHKHQSGLKIERKDHLKSISERISYLCQNDNRKCPTNLANAVKRCWVHQF